MTLQTFRTNKKPIRSVNGLEINCLDLVVLVVMLSAHCSRSQEVVRKFAREEIAPKAAEYDKTGEVCR